LFLEPVLPRASTIERLIKKLARRYRKLQVCFEAGPTGYGLYRQMQALGYECLVVAPALIPKRSGERVNTNRRDAITLGLDWLRRMIEALLGQPAPMSAGPVIPAAEDPPVSQQERQQLLALATNILGRRGAAANQVAHRLVHFVGHPYAGELARPEQIVFQDAVAAIEDAVERSWWRRATGFRPGS
jgi:transposase